MAEAYWKEGYRIRPKRADGQTTVEYLVILLVMIGLLIAVAIFFSPRLRNAVKDLVARIECALSLGNVPGCGPPENVASGGLGIGLPGGGTPGGTTTPGGSSSGGPASSGSAGTFSGGGSSSSGGSES